MGNAVGFGKNQAAKSSKRNKNNEPKPCLRLGGQIVFSIGVAREDLESGKGIERGFVLKDVLASGISIVIQKELEGFRLQIVKIFLKELEDGMTLIDLEFALEAVSPL